MKFFIVVVLTVWLATVLALPGREIKSRNVVVPAGRPEGRITRGNDARRGELPYQAGLLITAKNGESQWCGGSLISNTHILTAAHCIDDAANVRVLLGSTNRAVADAVYEVSPKDIVVHSEWNTVTLENDIALIKIPRTPYSETIQPIKLPDKSSADLTNEGEDAITSGWGYTSDYFKQPVASLKYAYTKIISNARCSQFFKNIKSTHICIATTGGISPCQGDSGGPLASTSSRTLLGITSFVPTIGCETQMPAAYTRVAKYLTWIRENSY